MDEDEGDKWAERDERVDDEAGGGGDMKRHYGGYRRTYTFGYTCLVYHATTLFCKRFCSYKDDLP